MENNLYIANDEEIKGHKEDIQQYIKKEMIKQLQEETDTENLADNLKMAADVLELIEDNEESDIITLKYNNFGGWYKAEEIQEEYVLQVQTLYNEYLEKTENRNISYGELAYIQGLEKEELDNLYNELLEEESETGKNV